MITGIHALLYSKDADATRALFRDVLGFSAVDAGHGWLIFALPPAELGIHPEEEDGERLPPAHPARSFTKGSVTLKVAPRVRLLRATMVPPWASRRDRAMESPMPMPPGLVV